MHSYDDLNRTPRIGDRVTVLPWAGEPAAPAEVVAMTGTGWAILTDDGTGYVLGSSRFAPTPGETSTQFPILQGLVTAGHITFLGDIYVGHASDGTAVAIGKVGREAAAEAYLTEHPTPDTW